MHPSLPKLPYLVPECVMESDGIGPVVEVGSERGKLLILTLSINCIVERESLIISVWGSPDNLNWGVKPLVSFPPKYYCGMYSILLNLAKYPDVQYVRAEWKVSRWGKGNGDPMFGFYVAAEPSGSRLNVKTARTA